MVGAQQIQTQPASGKVDAKWFPRAIVSNDDAHTRLRVFCFPGAGMESSIWTSTGTAASPMPNPFCEFAKTEGVSFFGVQLPFRGMRRKEPHPQTIQEAARQAMQAIRPLIARGSSPYVFVGYSMGAWVAYEALCVASKEGLPLPTRFIAAAMVSPNLPAGMRPWKCTSSLDTAAFQDQLRAWSCNEILFHPEMWAAYEPLLRADHRMLDSYKFTDMKGELKVPCSVFRGHEDKQLADDALFVGWFEVLGQTGNEKKAEVTLVEGDHGLVFNAANRQAFFKRLTDLLDSVLLAIEYGQ